LDVEDIGIEGIDRGEATRQPKNESTFAPLESTGINLDSTLHSLEKHYIEEAFRMAGGNESKAAKLLNMNHHTFRYRRKKLQEG
jgi:DNA-binding NtrC family response regulator